MHRFADKISSTLQIGLENTVKLLLGFVSRQTPARAPLQVANPCGRWSVAPLLLLLLLPLCTWRMAIPIVPSAVDVVKGT